MNEKPFEVGEWVWVWPAKKWGRISYVGSSMCHVDGVPYSPEEFSRNPVIPSKPKKIVTKEVSRIFVYDTPLAVEKSVHTLVPMNATNIRCTYEIPEEEA